MDQQFANGGHKDQVAEEQKQNTPGDGVDDKQTRVCKLRAGYGYGPYGTSRSEPPSDTAVYTHPAGAEYQKKDGGPKCYEDKIPSEFDNMEKRKDNRYPSDQEKTSAAGNYVPAHGTETEKVEDLYSEYVVPPGEIMNMGLAIKDLEQYSVSWY